MPNPNSGRHGAYGETDLAVALLGFVCSRENRSALGTAFLSSSSRARAHVAWPVYSRNESSVQKKCHLAGIFLSDFYFREIDLFDRFRRCINEAHRSFKPKSKLLFLPLAGERAPCLEIIQCQLRTPRPAGRRPR